MAKPWLPSADRLSEIIHPSDDLLGIGLAWIDNKTLEIYYILGKLQ